MRPDFVRRDSADAGQQPNDALESDLVAVVGGKLQERRHVLDVRLLEEPQAAGDGEGHAVAGEFDLEFERVEMRAVEDGDLVEPHALVAQFEDALGDELALLVAVV